MAWLFYSVRILTSDALLHLAYSLFTPHTYSLTLTHDYHIPGIVV